MSEHLYLHIPFCLKKCGYCDFYSLENQDRLPEFVGALKQEIRLVSPSDSLPGTQVKTLYFGGGTPSLLPLDSLEDILDTLGDAYGIAEDAEITLEANPGTVDLDYFRGLHRLGINRLSLGIQSLRKDKLTVLGRIHTLDQGRTAIEQARKAGFDNIGLDMIYGLPQETARDWRQEMAALLDYAPEHLSCYMLTLEKGTPLHRDFRSGRFTPMGAEDQVSLFSQTSAFLEEAGYRHYEISNFARGDRRMSRHNSAYWQMRPYTGFGPSAHSFRILQEEDGRTVPLRSWNAADLDRYLVLLAENRLPVAEEERLTAAQQMAELVMVGLRTRQGIPLALFDRLSELPFVRRFSGLMEDLAGQGLGALAGNGSHYALTSKGWARLDSIVEAFAGRIL